MNNEISNMNCKTFYKRIGYWQMYLLDGNTSGIVGNHSRPV